MDPSHSSNASRAQMNLRLGVDLVEERKKKRDESAVEVASHSSQAAVLPWKGSPAVTSLSGELT